VTTAEHLAEATFELLGIPSVSRREQALLDRIRGRMDGAAETRLVDDRDGVLAYLPAERRRDAELVVLAGHVDTVPVGGAAPEPHRLGGSLIGRGAADMKGGLAVMLALADDPPESDLDVGLVFFAREELPITESALGPLLAESEELRETALAIVLEPTANTLQLGCTGNLNATVTVHGRAAHAARPWTGDNAIHRAVRVLAELSDLPVREVDVDGLTFREVASVTTIAGGIADNVVPDRVRAHVNARYSPSTTPDAAVAWLRDLVERDGATVDIVANAPPGPVHVGTPLVERLRTAGGLEVGPKQAWTPVAEFGAVGVGAVNFGPGDPRYAHSDEERVEVDALVRGHDVLTAFLTGRTTSRGG
jgi:succinyl-diaminopimelate desuccinylase